MVLDHHDRVARVHQAVQAVQQPLNVGQVQAGGRLVQDIEVVAAALDLAQLVRQLDPLRLAAGERGRGLAELSGSPGPAASARPACADEGHGLEEAAALLDGHVQHLARCSCRSSVSPASPALYRRALADPAGHLHVRHEVQVVVTSPCAAALLAASALDVEAEAPGRVAARAGLRRVRRTDGGWHRRSRYRSPGWSAAAADRRLVDVDDVVQSRRLRWVVLAGEDAAVVERASRASCRESR